MPAVCPVLFGGMTGCSCDWCVCVGGCYSLLCGLWAWVVITGLSCQELAPLQSDTTTTNRRAADAISLIEACLSLTLICKHTFLIPPFIIVHMLEDVACLSGLVWKCWIGGVHFCKFPDEAFTHAKHTHNATPFEKTKWMFKWTVKFFHVINLETIYERKTNMIR